MWDTSNHTTTSVAGSRVSWDSGLLNTGATFDETFHQAGTFNYYCKIHGFDNGNGTAGGMAGTITVLPAATLSSIMLMPANPSIAANSTEQFMAMGMFSDGSSEDVTNQATWSSSNNSAATVSNAVGSKGLATGVAPGTSTVSAAFGGLSGSTQITVTAATSTPLVTVTNVSFARNKKHMVTQITVDFSGAVNVAEANSVATYRLAMPGKKGSFDAKNAKLIKLKSAVLNGALGEVILTPKKPFALSKPVQLRVNGLPPAGLQDSAGQLIDGDHNGQPGGNAVAVLRAKGVTLSAVALTASRGTSTLQATAAAIVMDQEVVIGVAHPAGAERLKPKTR